MIFKSQNYALMSLAKVIREGFSFFFFPFFFLTGIVRNTVEEGSVCQGIDFSRLMPNAIKKVIRERIQDFWVSIRLQEKAEVFLE
jgi:hypothetical protein